MVCRIGDKFLKYDWKPETARGSHLRSRNQVLLLDSCTNTIAIVHFLLNFCSLSQKKKIISVGIADFLFFVIHID